MENKQDRQYYMSIYMYTLNINRMEYKKEVNKEELKKIWENKHKLIEDYFNKAHNELI